MYNIYVYYIVLICKDYFHDFLSEALHRIQNNQFVQFNQKFSNF